MKKPGCTICILGPTPLSSSRLAGIVPGWLEFLLGWLESFPCWLESSWLAGVLSWLAGVSFWLAEVSAWLAGVSSWLAGLLPRRLESLLYLLLEIAA